MSSRPNSRAEIGRGDRPVGTRADAGCEPREATFSYRESSGAKRKEIEYHERRK
jgi:hypothetical protein